MRFNLSRKLTRLKGIMSAHLNVSTQVGGYNLEDNTDPEFANSVYNIFDKDAPPSETDKRYAVYLLPERKIAEDTTVITYTMTKQNNKFTDLAGIRIVGGVQLEKQKNGKGDWKPITASDTVSVINNVAQSQFSKIIVTLNDTEITDPASDPYPYTSYMATLFNTTKEFKEHLKTEIYWKDSPGTFDVTEDIPLTEYSWKADPDCFTTATYGTPNFTDGKFVDCTESTMTVLKTGNLTILQERNKKFNEGFVKRREMLLGRTEAAPFLRRLDHDIVTALSVAPPRTTIGIKFYKKDQDFLILKDAQKHAADKFRLLLVDMMVEMQLSTVKPKVGTPYMRMLKSPSHLPTVNFTRNFTKMYNVLADHSLDFSNPHWITNGQIPDTIILSFVRQKTFLGDDTRNPFNMEMIQFNAINLITDGTQFNQHDFNSNTEAGRRHLYHMMQDSCGRNQQTGFMLDISYEEFVGGFFFLYFDLTPPKDNRATKTAKREGNMQIRLKTDADSQKNKFLDEPDNWVVLVHSVFAADAKFYGDQVVVSQFV